jgi:hypothetical protein
MMQEPVKALCNQGRKILGQFNGSCLSDIVESRSYAGWPSARHVLRPPIGQLTSTT